VQELVEGGLQLGAGAEEGGVAEDVETEARAGKSYDEAGGMERGQWVRVGVRW
jgi:hypothetical protein